MTPRAYYATQAVAAAVMRDNPGRRARVLHRIPPRGACLQLILYEYERTQK